MCLTSQIAEECPICFDTIGKTNNITTECGHKFHARCIMTNVSHNGFVCPCCRAVMAEEPEDDNSDDSVTLLDDEDEYEEDDEEDEEDEEDEGTFSEDALRGLRLFTNLLEGEENDQSDVVAEYQFINQTLPPSCEFIENSLKEQGITYKHLVACILMDHKKYDSQFTELEIASGDVWGKLKFIISNYIPVEEEISLPVEEEISLLVEEEISLPVEVFEELRLNLTIIMDDEFQVDEDDVVLEDICNALQNLHLDNSIFEFDYHQRNICV
jgi:hypothetical protein